MTRAATGTTCCALREPFWFCDRAWCQLAKTFVSNTPYVMLLSCTMGCVSSFYGHFFAGYFSGPSELAATSVEVTHTDIHSLCSILALSWSLPPFCLLVVGV